jgi:hypothetical protein
LRQTCGISVLPQQIAKGQMLAGVHYSFSLACMLRDPRKPEILLVRAP